ncbi:MAG: sigma-54-dependent Fis family transcriptional regulator [Acidobacteria bacterium]|nr:sigma-54-dependent Fis family transcriptional regulator [Acidobacteriota bacterium]
MAKPRILVVDDEKLVRVSLQEYFERQGYPVLVAADAAEANRILREEQPQAVLLDVRLPDRSGMELLEEWKQAGLPGAVVMMTADPQLDDVKAAIKLGAYDFVSKPLDFDELSVTLSNALEASELRREVRSLRDEVRKRTGYREVVGTSETIRKLMDFVLKVARSEARSILITGESGTGKDLIAKVIHYESARADKSFVAINCSAIPETLLEAELFGHERGAFTDAKAMKRGLFEVADQGTLLLDEISEMSPFLQAKLLRVLEDQTFRRVGGLRDLKVDVRVIAASNRDLERMVVEKRFREDLFYRLSVISVPLPPLRERKEDILPLAEFFLRHYSQKFRKPMEDMTEELRRVLVNYDWPGNVRELKNAIERAMILEEGKNLTPSYLPIRVTSPHTSPLTSAGDDSGGAWTTTPDGRRIPLWEIPAGGTRLDEVERMLVEQALKQAHGNQSQAARLLDISRDALRYKMKKFRLERN